ncbi:MAG: hypothetical protein HWQ38_37825 [Nostoc sp. NMS7]|uniref:hypothetical protein n=1 Tax=Nostoc sp. NMS7 TaxID=2815391 RepID=UPI0025DABB59|nr:hypothetical protein [Nostoc sp. NMS7]MBN3951917.1 hypothetical protein [Nostoc sp. NMS7]
MHTTLLDSLLAKPIAFHRIFATIGGGATEGLFLSQAYYWSFRTTLEDNWFYKTQKEWCQETALTRNEQTTARKRLLKLKILEEKKEGLPSQLFYRINRERLYELILTKGSNPDGCQIVENDNLDISSLQNPVSKPATNNIQSIYTENTSETTSPLTPQGEKEGERNFGFEIGQEATTQPFATLLSQPKTTQLTSKPFMQAIVPAAVAIAKTDKFFTGKTRDQQKYDRWAETAHPALVYGGEDTPWLEPPTRAEFIRFNQSFVDWHTSRCMEKFHKQDKFQAEADFVASLRNTAESCASRWAEYHKHMICHAATAAARMNNGIEISDIEKQKFIKHQRAFTGITPESTESIDPKIMASAQPAPITPVLESVATVPDDIWDKVKSATDEYEIAATATPEGAENAQMYKHSIDLEARAYYEKLDQQNKKSQSLSTAVESVDSPKPIAEQIKNLASSKSMPRVSDQDKEDKTRLSHWNDLLATGLPTVMADAERQALKAGYIIVDGQAVEPEF